VAAETDDRLSQLGIEVIDDRRDPRVRAECMRIARRLRDSGRRVIGLLPATPRVGIPGVAVQLGVALVDLSGATVAYVDANVRWPAMSEVALAAPRAAEDDVFATRWLHRSLAVLAPRTAQAAGAGIPELARVIEQGGELFQHVLVDLTGLDRLGEHLAAMALCQGVVVVAEAGRTHERELVRAEAEVTEDRRMGVLLVG
jgi:hypothetical protein